MTQEEKEKLALNVLDGDKEAASKLIKALCDEYNEKECHSQALRVEANEKNSKEFKRRVSPCRAHDMESDQ